MIDGGVKGIRYGPIQINMCNHKSILDNMGSLSREIMHWIMLSRSVNGETVNICR